jgi:heptosyltransferase-3
MPEDSTPTLLVVHPGSLGDVLLSVAALRALRRAWPAHELTLLVRGEIGRLLEACGEVDRILPMEGPALTELLGGPGVPPHLAGCLRRCAAAVCWMADPGPDAALEKNLKDAGVGRIIVQSPHGHGLEAVHAADRYLDILKPWRLQAPEAPPILRLPDDLAPAGIADGASGIAVIAVHPGSGSAAKCLDGRRLASAVQAVCDGNTRSLLVLGGPADEGLVAAFRRHLTGVEPVTILHRDLVTVAVALARARVFVGHDSGITHLAAMLGVPTVALFGPTDPSRWAPRGRSVKVLRGAPCACRDRDQVQHCRRPCLDIPQQQIIEAIESCLNAQDSGAVGLPCSEQVC